MHHPRFCFNSQPPNAICLPIPLRRNRNARLDDALPSSPPKMHATTAAASSGLRQPLRRTQIHVRLTPLQRSDLPQSSPSGAIPRPRAVPHFPPDSHPDEFAPRPSCPTRRRAAVHALLPLLPTTARIPPYPFALPLRLCNPDATGPSSSHHATYRTESPERPSLPAQESVPRALSPDRLAPVPSLRENPADF